MALSREELFEKYGRPEFYEWRESNTIYVSLHASQEAAQAYADANNTHYGHPSWIEHTVEDEWLSVADLRPALAEIHFRSE